MICKSCTHESYCDMAAFGGHTPPITACSKFTEKSQTNADRIRAAMTDEELGEFLAEIRNAITCVLSNEDGCINVDLPCSRCWEMWLKSPVEVDE